MISLPRQLDVDTELLQLTLYPVQELERCASACFFGVFIMFSGSLLLISDQRKQPCAETGAGQAADR
jgi:hypothetical protein